MGSSEWRSVCASGQLESDVGARARAAAAGADRNGDAWPCNVQFGWEEPPNAKPCALAGSSGCSCRQHHPRPQPGQRCSQITGRKWQCQRHLQAFRVLPLSFPSAAHSVTSAVSINGALEDPPPL
mmetsp:Transcript_39207/g.71456  ORF Transcript_39207/g.71456 Transcript_39207/m.71456 type:complete len:125 (+) Transcript_39207:497-871(+)